MKGLENAIRNLNSLDTRMVPQASAWAINRVAQKAVSVATRQVTGLTVSPASASVKVGATTTLTFTVKPDGASDKAISVHSSDPQTATVTLNGLVATVKGVKQGSVSIVGMTADGNFVAVAAVTVSAAG